MKISEFKSVGFEKEVEGVGEVAIAISKDEKNYSYVLLQEGDDVSPLHSNFFESALSFDKNGTATVSDSDGYYHVHVVDSQVVPLYEKRFKRVFPYKPDNVALVEGEDGKTFFIDMEGEEISLAEMTKRNAPQRKRGKMGFCG